MTVEVEERAPAAPAEVWHARPVRLALLVDAPAQPAWVAQVLEAVTAGGQAALVGVGVFGGAPGALRAARRAEDAYRRFDARRYGRPDDPTRPVDLASLLDGVPVAEVRVAEAAGTPSAGAAGADARGVALAEGAGRQLRAWDADVVWYLGTRPLAEPVPAVAAWGVWTLDPGASDARAVLEGAPATVSTLRRLSDLEGVGGVLARARTSTQRVSVTANRAEHLRHVAALVAGVIGRASRLGPPRVALDGVDDGDARGPRDALAGGEVVRLAVRAVSRVVRGRVEDARTVPQWTLAYHFADALDADAAADVAPPCTDGRRFTELVPPPDRYWADPFPAEHEGRYYVFFEEHLAGVRDAHLSVAELDPVRGLVDPRVVLRRDYHLSYPSVFRWEGDWYMIPETGLEGRVELYRAEAFPDAWARVGDLLAGACFVDATVAEVGGRWWMFVGVVPPGAGEATESRLYHAPNPLGLWAPHPLNPLAVDVRAGRPAGRVFRRDGAYYRPVQDGAPHYGHAMTICRVDALTPTAFRETPVARVEPTWRPGLLGTHTLNAAGRLTVLDAQRRVPRRPPA